MTIYITCLFFRPRTVFKENISSHRLGSIERMGTFFTLNRQIGKGSRLFFEIWNWELGAYFCTFGHWEPDVRFSKEPDLLQIEEPDFNVKI